MPTSVSRSSVSVNLMNSVTQGLPLLIKYSPHVIVVALEELGYLMMGPSILFIGIAMNSKGRLESAFRWTFVIGFILVMLSLMLISMRHRPERLDWFELLAISVDWLVLVISGIMLSSMFRRHLRGLGARSG